MFQYSSKSFFSGWPEQLKVLLLFVFTFLAFFLNSAELQLALFLALFLFLLAAGYGDFRKLYTAILPFLIVSNITILLFMLEIVSNPIVFALVVSLRVLNMFQAIAFFVFTTDLFAVMKLLKKLRVPEFIFLPLYVLLRFLPEIERDLLEIAAVQKVRGISPKKPLLYLKAVFVPLFLSSLEKAEQISIAYYLRKKREKG